MFRTEREAIAYAMDRSTDWRVLAESVTRFTIGELGTRHPVAWFVKGKEQPHRDARPGRFYPTAVVHDPGAFSPDGLAGQTDGRR